jgi:flagellar basal-body rod protein FlgC
MSVFSTALSGMQAQSAALNTHAKNIANMRSGDYELKKPVFKSRENGGVIADEVDIDPSHVKVYDPDSVEADEEGLVSVPNISLEEEIFGVLQTKHAYAASAKVVQVQRDMDREVLDILT